MSLTIGGRELYLYLVNDSRVYPRLTAIRANLTRKKASGKYLKSKAPQGFSYAVKDSAMHYASEFGGAWNKLFTKEDRDSVAKQLTEDFEEEYKLGNYNEYIPKKYRKK